MYSELTLIFILLLFFGFSLEKVLELLNQSYFKKPLNKEFAHYFSAENQNENLSYKQAKFRFGFLQSTLSFILTFVFWKWSGLGFLNNLVVGLVDYQILQSLLFFGIIALASAIMALPFSIYYHFVLEERFGFNKMTPKIFILDLIKSGLLGAVIGGGLLAIVIWVYIALPGQFWWIVWLIVSVFMIFMSAFYARIILPLFNRQTELEEGELKDAIVKMGAGLGFDLHRIFVIDGSKRSTKANAFFTGFGRQKRIVLYDTLINDLETNEILAVLAHEIGHYKHNHTLKGMILGIFQTGILLYFLSLFIHPESALALELNRVVAQDENLMQPAFFLGLVGFGIIFSPVSTIIEVLMNILSRRFEYQADAFAADKGLALPLVESLVKLSKKSLSNLNPHPAYVFFNYSHPPLLARLIALKDRQSKT